MSNSKFPQYSNSAQTGSRGIRIVDSIVSDQLGWIFRPQEDQKDFGIDAQIEIVEQNNVLGRMIAAQIKTGDSFLRRKNEYGYIYKGEQKHLNYFLNYTLPVILILCDPKTENCWWCEIRAQDIDEAEAGWQITVPFTQTFDIQTKAMLAQLAGPAKDHLPELRRYWETNKVLLEGALLLITVPRTDIESGDITFALDSLHRISDSQKLAKKYKESIDLSVFGYEDDPRELYEIPEVRNWMQKLDKQFPYWLYFLSKETRSLAFIPLALCDFYIDRKLRIIEISNPCLSRYIEAHFPAMNEMCYFAGFDDIEIFELSTRVVTFFFSDYKPDPKYAR